MPKPIIHGRDHEHGGADPARIVYESVGTGGDGGGLETTDGTVDVNPTTLLSIGTGITLTNPSAGEAHLAAGGGGGGGVVLGSEQLVAADIVAPGAFVTNYFSFSHSLGDTLVGFTDPEQPAALADGVYIFSAVVSVSGSLSTPTAAVLVVGLGTSLVATSQETIVAVSGGPPPTVSLMAAKNLSAGEQIRVEIVPGDTSATFTIFRPVVTFIGAA